MQTRDALRDLKSRPFRENRTCTSESYTRLPLVSLIARAGTRLSRESARSANMNPLHPAERELRERERERTGNIRALRRRDREIEGWLR